MYIKDIAVSKNMTWTHIQGYGVISKHTALERKLFPNRKSGIVVSHLLGIEVFDKIYKTEYIRERERTGSIASSDDSGQREMETRL